MSSNLGLNDTNSHELLEHESKIVNTSENKFTKDTIQSNDIAKCNTQMEDEIPAVKTSNDLISSESLSNDPVIEDIGDDNSNVRPPSGDIHLVEIRTGVIDELTAENNEIIEQDAPIENSNAKLDINPDSSDIGKIIYYS